MLHRGIFSAWSQHSSSCVQQQLHQHVLIVRSCSLRPVIQASINPPGLTGNLHARSSVAAAAISGDAVHADVAAAPTTRRRRRKLFSSEPHDATSPADTQQQQQQQQQQEKQDEHSSTRQHRQRTQAKASHQQDVQHGCSQAKLHWWQSPAAGSELLLHVFWDLDNLHPDHWNQAKQLVGILKSTLRPYGRLQQLQAYANGNTLVSRVDTEGIDEVLESEDELRCPMCGRRCKSFEDLQKHFKQLHEREHQKKMRGPKKFAAKYFKSDKAARVRDAGRLYGTPKKNRSGRKGQMVRAVLKRAGLTVIEVASQSQAADEAINRHVDSLVRELREAEPQEPQELSPLQKFLAETEVEAAAAVSADGSIEAEQQLCLDLLQLPNVQACLDRMLWLPYEDLKVAWRCLRQMGSAPNKRAKQELWTQLRLAHREKRKEVTSHPVVRAPDWLNSNWQEYHRMQQELDDSQRQEREAAEAAAAEAAAAAGEAPWGSENALQQSVLVIVSNDRGFAGTVAKWLQRGGAGSLLVTTRGSSGWEQPLSTALSSSGSQKRLTDVICASWEDIISQLDYYDSGDDSWDDSDMFEADNAFGSEYDEPYL